MRILVFSEVFWPEDFIINDLVKEWYNQGHDVEVVTQYPSYPQSYVFDGYINKGYTTEVWEGIKIHRFPFVEGYRDSKINKIRNYFRYIRGGKRVVDMLKGRYDCIFVSQTGPLTVAYPALYAKKKIGAPVNIWTCDIWPDAVWGYGIPRFSLFEAFLDRLIRKVYNGSDRIFVSSKLFSETIRNYTDKICIYAPNWLRPVENVVSDIRLPKEKVNFTFTGNISRYQNLINTVIGFVKSGIKNAQLNIIGDGSYLTEVKEVAKKLKATGVVFYGRRPYNEMFDLLSQSQVLVLPLIPQEGIEKTEPFKIQSYLQAGKPILGILNGAGRDIIEENALGLCVDPVDSEAIADGFIRMMEFSRVNGPSVKEKASMLLNGRFNKRETVRLISEQLIHL